MKKIASLSILLMCLTAIPFSFSSCDKLKEALNFSVDDNQDIFIDIPPAAAGQQSSFSAVPFNLKAELDANNTSGHSIDISKIQYIKVTAVHISILSGANTNNNFANFTDGGVLINSNASASTQSNATLAQFLNNPDAFSTELEIPVQGGSGSDLKAWLQGTQVNYVYAYNLRRPLTTTLHCKIHLVYDINIQG